MASAVFTGRMYKLVSASGIGGDPNVRTKTMRLIRHGCTNRPFFHIVVQEYLYDKDQPVVEQLGTFDPMPNESNEKLVSLNYERIKFWLAHGVGVTNPVSELLGLAGYLPVHPRTYLRAWRHRRDGRRSMPNLTFDFTLEDPPEVKLKE